jgi:hypothetical protein
MPPQDDARITPVHAGSARHAASATDVAGLASTTMGGVSYDRFVHPGPLSLDTTPQIEQRQIESWRRMLPAQKLNVALAMSAAVRQLALAGVRRRYPDASPREQFLRLAIITLGDELARRAYPEIGTLDSL